MIIVQEGKNKVEVTKQTIYNLNTEKKTVAYYGIIRRVIAINSNNYSKCFDAKKLH